MRITICSSAFFVKESYEIKKKLENKGHTVFIYPQEIEINGKLISVENYYEMRKKNLTEDLLKVRTSLMEDHIKRIEESDAILVLNFDKEGEKGYIGGNSFLEMALAFYLKKKIFLWQKPGNDSTNFEEVLSLNPKVIEEKLEKIK